MIQTKRSVSLLLLLLICLGGFSSVTAQEPVDYVNPYIGNISHLLVPTFPTIHLPNSMLRVIPARWDNTTDRLQGLAVVTTSHRGSSAFTISPYQGASDNLQPEISFSYDHEKVTPYSYEVFFDDVNITASFAVSFQSGIYYIDFDGAQKKYLLINNRNGAIHIDKNSVSGFQVVSNDVTQNTTKVFLYLEVDQTPQVSGILTDGKIGQDVKADGRHKCAVLKFADDTERIKVRYGISFISEEQAKKNLYREIAGFDKDTVEQRGRKIWNETLGKIQIKGGSEDDRIVFYTSLYRTYERPVCISEDGHYFSAFDGTVHGDNGVPFYTDDWIWDTYRATHPLRCLTEKEMELDIIRSFIRMAEQMDDFWMPTFPEITGDSRRMNSNHGVVSVLDAYVKGLTYFDLEKAYRAWKGAITYKTLEPWSAKPAALPCPPPKVWGLLI